MTPPTFRTRPRTDIDRITRDDASLYYPEYSPEDLERQVLMAGIYVRLHVAHKVAKILEFNEPIGASNGEPSSWVKIEATNGEYHGRPISREEFQTWQARSIPCC